MAQRLRSPTQEFGSQHPHYVAQLSRTAPGIGSLWPRTAHSFMITHIRNLKYRYRLHRINLPTDTDKSD